MAGTSRPHPFSVTLTDAGYAASGEILTDDVMAYGETVGRSRQVVVGASMAPTTTHEGHAVLAVLASRLGAAPTARLWRLTLSTDLVVKALALVPPGGEIDAAPLNDFWEGYARGRLR